MSELNTPLRLALVVAVGAALAAPTALADVDPDAASADSARRGAAYLAGRQGPEGAVPAGEDQTNRVGEAVLAMAAGGGQESSVELAIDYLRERVPTTVDCGDNDAAEIGQVTMGVVAAGEDPRSFGGRDLVTLMRSCAKENGGYQALNLYSESLVMLALLSAGTELRPEDVTYLRDRQCLNGAWRFGGAACVNPDAGETDFTALAMSVLIATHGTSDPDVREARQWLLDAQEPGGCWASKPGFAESANSCGLALSALAALGEDREASPWADGQYPPAHRLRQFQQPGGEFWPQLDDDAGSIVMATIQAVPGMAGWSYPVSSPGEGGNGEPGSGGPDATTTTTTATATTGKKSSGGSAPTTLGTAPKAASGATAGRDNGAEATSPTTGSRVRGKTADKQKQAWPALADRDSGVGADSVTRRSGRPPDLVAREVGDEGSGVAAAGVVATGALGSVGLGIGAVWWRRRGLGFL